MNNRESSKTLIRDQRGLTTVEYIIVLGCTSAKHFGQEGTFVKRRFMVLA